MKWLDLFQYLPNGVKLEITTIDTNSEQAETLGATLQFKLIDTKLLRFVSFMVTKEAFEKTSDDVLLPYLKEMFDKSMLVINEPYEGKT